MSSRESALKFIELVEIHFPAPKFNGDEDRDELWTNSIAGILAPYDDSVVLEAAATIVKTRDPAEKGGSMFPKPFEIIKVLDEIKERQRVRAMPLIESAEAKTRRERFEAEVRSWTPDRQKLATDLCLTPLGQRAAREGWVVALWNYARHNMRLPEEQKDIDELRRQGLDTRKAVEAIISAPAKDKLDVAMQDMAGAVLKSGDDLAHSILKGSEAA